MNQVVSRHDLFQSIGGQGVNAWKIHDNNLIVLFQPAFLFFNGDTGPVPHKLVGTRQRVKQGCFAAVWVACQGNSDIHCDSPSPDYD